jgi:hypothetical protein
VRHYIITLLVLAFLIGSLFRGADVTGNHFMKMFGTIGILFFGIVGTMAISRWQTRQGLQEVESELKALEPEAYITDWAYRRDGRPDFLVVGPTGLLAVCLDETAQSVKGAKVAGRVEKARARARAAAEWVRKHVSGRAEGLGSLNGLGDLPIRPILVLTRRKVLPEFAGDGVAVVNADQLRSEVAPSSGALLDPAMRVKLTRLLRES